ncbi:MAG: type II toxin-antitoxin system VapC family toxin [Candidatus Binatia bacterium]
MNLLLLDTHVWVWWLTSPDTLTKRQRAAIERTRRHGGQPLLVSIISCWEVALLGQRGRLRFSIPLGVWLEQAVALPGLEVVPLSLPIILAGARLSRLRDPADQLIVATAHDRGARLVTSDRRIAAADEVPVIA